MKKSVCLNILLLILVILISFSILEVIFRITYNPKSNLIPITTDSNSELIYKKAEICFKEDANKDLKQLCLDIFNQFNHPKKIEKIKSKNVFRILCLGDSFTQGTCCVKTFEETYPYQLEKMLNENSKGLTYEVYTIGFGGFNTYQELTLLKEVGLQYNPDMIILQYYFNDIAPMMELSNVDNHMLLLPNKDFVLVDQELVPTILPLSFKTNKLILTHSYFVRFLSKKLDILNQKFFMNYNAENKKWEKINFDTLEKIIKISKEENIPFILIFVSGAIEERCTNTYDTYLKLKVKGIALQNDIRFIDLCDYTQGYNYSELQSRLIGREPYDHYNAKGNRIMAEALFENIKRLGLV